MVCQLLAMSTEKEAWKQLVQSAAEMAKEGNTLGAIENYVSASEDLMKTLDNRRHPNERVILTKKALGNIHALRKVGRGSAKCLLLLMRGC